MGTFYSMMVKSEADRKAWSTSLSYFWEMHMMTKMASHQTRTVMMSRKTESPERSPKTPILQKENILICV